tara:strand:- start:724 stop:1146 length:423 start_codon:yes stop_codon:yes gene_type:complete
MKVEFTRHSLHDDQRDAVVTVSLPKLMGAWQDSNQAKMATSQNDHPSGETEKAAAKRGFYEEKLKNGEPIEMARVNLGIIFDEDFNWAGNNIDPATLEIGDGRHRLTEMLQEGVDAVQVSVPKTQVEDFVAQYGAEVSGP